jgi:hypothetical protein
LLFQKKKNDPSQSGAHWFTPNFGPFTSDQEDAVVGNGG